MTVTHDWSRFYLALCTIGPQLLLGLDDGEEVREIVAMIAASTDSFWSDGLEPLLADHAADGDLRGGVIAVLEQWADNVVTTLSEEFTIELDRGSVSIDGDSPLIDQLVVAATPATA